MRSERRRTPARTQEDAMKIIVFGPNGMIGSRIVAELEQRGHDVTGVSRASGIDATDPAAVAPSVAGADAVISAVSRRDGGSTLVDVANGLTAGLRRAGVRRLLVVGGALEPRGRTWRTALRHARVPRRLAAGSAARHRRARLLPNRRRSGLDVRQSGRIDPARRADSRLPPRRRAAAGRRERAKRDQRRGLRGRDRRPRRTEQPRSRAGRRRLVGEPPGDGRG